MRAGYSTRDVARLLGVPARRVYWFADAGFVEPRRDDGTLRFSFQDLVILRAAQGLLAAEIPPHRVKSALARLRRQLPGGRSLAAVRITADGGQIVARDGAEVWEPESGQHQIPFADYAEFQPFAVAELAERAAPFGRRALAEAERRGDLDAEEWYELGWELEATALEEARAAYRRALATDPAHPDAHLNLGRLLHGEGDLAAAETHYRAAESARPGDATAAYNLGVVLQDLDRLDEAVDAYRRAVAADPTLADAWFNLAGLYSRLGQPMLALQSLKAYRALAPPG